MFNLSSFFFTTSVSDSVANNLIASVIQHFFWGFLLLLEGCFFSFLGFFFFPEVTFVEERILIM